MLANEMVSQLVALFAIGALLFGEAIMHDRVVFKKTKEDGKNNKKDESRRMTHQTKESYSMHASCVC